MKPKTRAIAWLMPASDRCAGFHLRSCHVIDPILRNAAIRHHGSQPNDSRASVTVACSFCKHQIPRRLVVRYDALTHFGFKYDR